MSTTRSTQQPHRIDARSLLVRSRRRRGSGPASLDVSRAAKQLAEHGFDVSDLAETRDLLEAGNYMVDPDAIYTHFHQRFNVGRAILIGVILPAVLIGVAQSTLSSEGSEYAFLNVLKVVAVLLLAITVLSIAVTAALRGTAPFLARTRRRNLAAAILESCCTRALADR